MSDRWCFDQRSNTEALFVIALGGDDDLLVRYVDDKRAVGSCAEAFDLAIEIATCDPLAVLVTMLELVPQVHCWFWGVRFHFEKCLS